MIHENQPNVDPYDWHVMPTRGDKCEVCGCPEDKAKRQHRLTRPEEKKDKWIVRQKSRGGWQERPVPESGEQGTSKARKDRPRSSVSPGRPPGIHKETVILIGKAAALFAAGKPWDEIVTALDGSTSNLRELKQRYADLWQAAVDKAMEAQRAVIEAMAATTAVLENTQIYLSARVVNAG